MSSGQMTEADIQALKDNIQAQVMVQGAQQLLEKVTTKCYQKCVSKPGSRLDKSDNNCIAMCMDRYMDVHRLVQMAYAERVSRGSGFQ